MHHRPFLFACVVTGLLAAAGCSNLSGSLGSPVPKSVDDAIAQITSKPAYTHSRWGIVVVDPSTGEKLIDREGAGMFVPGSIMKVYSTTAALKAFGPDYRFRTPVYATSVPRGGILAGHLILVASGDFSFGLREQSNGTLAFNNFPEIDHNYGDVGLAGPALLKNSDPLSVFNQLARQVRAAGISTIIGDVAIDDRLFNNYDGWPNGVMAPIWINENVVDITAAPSSVGQAAVVDWRPKIGTMRLASDVMTVANAAQAKPLSVKADANGTLHVSGAVAAGAKPSLTIWYIQKPADFARIAFMEALRRAGVTITAFASGSNPTHILPKDYRRARMVAEHVSPPLSEFVKVILKVSYNRGADLMVCLLAVKSGSRDCADGLGPELKTIKNLGVSPESTIVFEGAGTGDMIRTSPADEAAVLRSLLGVPWGKYVHDGMSIMGVDGTQAENQAGTPVAGHIRAKDGTQIAASPSGQVYISAKTEVGYIDAKSGKQLIYGVFVNDVPIGQQGMMETFSGVDRDLSTIAAAIQQGY
ncbi:MAG TPA: D-alanyl-D-alanine carboxypeptidase/D-alanyl-D-alanine-endopeptidase [Candidatus Rubrimentiphilum sp.]|nr:D-alanyl-D-alanine carboxypeptidase/D-alanyl-D-alanine-endopeptidase [Candidatus Rubrimentiphilum sp.]